MIFTLSISLLLEFHLLVTSKASFISSPQSEQSFKGSARRDYHGHLVIQSSIEYESVMGV